MCVYGENRIERWRTSNVVGTMLRVVVRVDGGDTRAKQPIKFAITRQSNDIKITRGRILLYIIRLTRRVRVCFSDG